MSLKEMQGKLERVLDPESIIMTTELCSACEVDGKLPRAIVTPLGVEQVAALLAMCSAEGWAVIPWGGGTQIGVGNLPRRYDLAIDLTHLDHIADYDPTNLTLMAGAGCTLKTLDDALAENSQFLPLDLPMPERVTLGGALASNAFGPSRLRYGSARDLVLGIQVVLPGGERLDLGGRTVKNVAGYDLTKLFIGSFGSLGVITQATCRLLPRPHSSQTLVAGFPAESEAFGLVGQVMNSRLLPTRLDLIQGVHLGDVSRAVISAIIGIDGSPETVERQVRDLGAMARSAGAVVDVLETELARNVTRHITSLPTTSRAEMIVRVGLPISQVGRFWRDVGQAQPPGDSSVSLLARAGIGTAYVMADAEEAALVESLKALRSLADALGGYAVAERLPASLKAGLDVWGPRRDDSPLMEALKVRFDPSGIMSPGRFVGGI